MSVYRVCIVLHFAAAFLWLGHMFFWSIFAAPMLKRVDPPEMRARLVDLSMRMGGLGWPALAVLIATGTIMLRYRGIGLGDLLSPDLLAQRSGQALAMKLFLVGGMIGYQIVYGHRPSRHVIYLNMLAALLVLGASVVLAGR